MLEKLKTRQEIAAEMGISRNTLSRRLKSSNLELPPGLLTLEEVAQIKNLVHNRQQFKTRKEIAAEIGISRNTLARRLKSAKLELPPGLLTLEEAVLIKNLVDNHQLNDTRHGGKY